MRYQREGDSNIAPTLWELSMTTDCDDLLSTALQLPPQERARLACSLLASLDIEDDDGADVDAAWAAEVRQRSLEYDTGAVTAVPWSEVRSQVRRRVSALSSSFVLKCE